jgi:hypothetical protein
MMCNVGNNDSTSSSPGSIPATILIVDDQPENLAVIGDYLMECGFTNFSVPDRGWWTSAR